MKKIVYLVFYITVFSSCSKKDDESAAIACFSVDVTESTDSTHSFLFDQCPPAYDVSYWDFGDGQYSSNPNPSHQFNHYGTYNVKLTVTNSAAQTNSVTRTINIGHYSLDKVIFRQSLGFYSPPYSIALFYPFACDTILSTTIFPLTHLLPDSTLFDLLYSNTTYSYIESNFSNPLYINVPIHSNQIINNQLDVSLAIPSPPDTIKLSLHYKFVYR